MSMRIVSAAVCYQGVIFSLPAPNRHHHILHAMHQMGLPNSSHREQGFLTDEGRYIDRLGALEVAQAADQIISNETTWVPAIGLFTEDLW